MSSDRISAYLHAVQQSTLDDYYARKEQVYTQRRKKVEPKKGPRRKKQ